jgi:hypothetical protein
VTRRPPRPLPDDVAQGLAAGVYIATGDAVAKLGRGVTAARLRDWNRRTGVDVQVVRHPDGEPCRVAAAHGHENVWTWEQLDTAEARLRTSGRGRPRRAHLD